MAAAGLQSLEAQCPEGNGSTFTLPQTIRNAIQVVESFYERYLWVNAPCIIQDNEEEKCEELSKISAIDARAHFTIVAAAGNDSDHGLLGVKYNKVGGRPRDTDSEGPEGLEDVRSAIRDHQKRIESSVWSSRGWTLQEQLFSGGFCSFSTMSSPGNVTSQSFTKP